VFLFGVGHEIISTTKQRKRRKYVKIFPRMWFAIPPDKIALSKKKRDRPLDLLLDLGPSTRGRSLEALYPGSVKEQFFESV
jgi:hypothetical protein